MWLNRFDNAIGVAGELAMIGLVMIATCGCEQAPTTVSGSVTLDGKPLAIASNARGTVIFQPVSGQGTMSTGLLDSAGHFQMATGGSLEVAPGKHQVAVSVIQLAPMSQQEEQGAELITPAKYTSARDSDLQADVTPGENQLTFNLSSSTGDDKSILKDTPSDTLELKGVELPNNPNKSN